MKRRLPMSRRTAGWLMALMAALVVVHYAYRNVPTALTRAVTGTPAIRVALKGEITHITPQGLTVTLEDAHGGLTKLTRHVVLTQSTRIATPGKPIATGDAGYKYLQNGLRVIVQGQGTATNDVIAQVVNVTFPLQSPSARRAPRANFEDRSPIGDGQSPVLRECQWSSWRPGAGHELAWPRPDFWWPP